MHISSLNIPETPTQASPSNQDFQEDDQKEMSSSDERDFEGNDEEQHLQVSSSQAHLHPDNNEEEPEDEERLQTLLKKNLSILVRSNDTIQDLLTIAALSRNQAELDMESINQILISRN